MAQEDGVIIPLKIPREYVNRLNNFYLENFGYDIRTQLFIYIHSELKKCGDYSEDTPKCFPIPSIRKKGDDFILNITYPDGTKSLLDGKTWERNLDLMKEWSKYQYDKSAREKVMLNVLTEEELKNKPFPNIRRGHSKYAVASTVGNRKKFFGHYDTIEEAIEVRDFLEKHNWDSKYHSSNVMKERDDITQFNYSEYLLNLVRRDDDNVEK